MNIKKTIGIVLILLLTLLVIYLYIPKKIRIKNYDITTNKTKEKLKILLISDYHNYLFNKDIIEKLETIKKEKPDIIVLAGDIFQEKTDNKNTYSFLEKISGSIPIYYVTGNHEYYKKNVKNIDEILEKYNIKRLQGNIIDIPNRKEIKLIGIDDPDIGKRKYQKQLEEIENKLNIEKYNILIAHRPERTNEYEKLGLDLVLSGHAHGGQIRIPYLFEQGLLSPNQGLFPKKTGGIYYTNDIIQIVSTGLGNNVIIPRINNPPEIVLIKINYQ